MIKKTGVTFAAITIATLMSGCGVGEANMTETIAENDGTPLPVATSQPVRADIFARYHTTGTLQSDSDAPVLARVSGEVVEILVEEGDKVREGQILARLDGKLLALQMQQAKANLDKLKNEYQRLVGLAERGLVSKAMYEGMQFDIEALQATYDLKKLDYGYTVIKAPISGVVSSREIKIGRQVNVNDPTFRITDTSRLVAYLKIPQTELAKFSAGHSLSLRVDAMPEILFAATIDRISPTIDVANGTFRATAYIDNVDDNMAPGMFGRFSIAYEKHDDALVIPSAALIKEDGSAVVYVVVNGEATRREVKFGIESDGMVEILGGLEIDDSVVVQGQSGLRDGTRVLAMNSNADSLAG